MPNIFKFPNKKNRFTLLVQPHLSALFKYAWKLTGNRDDAEDLLQTVLCRLYPKTSELEQKSELQPWLYKVLHNAYIDELRYRNRRPDFAGHASEAPELIADCPLPLN